MLTATKAAPRASKLSERARRHAGELGPVSSVSLVGYDKLSKEAVIRAFLEKLEAKYRTMAGAFRAIDANGDGTVDAYEFTAAVLLVLASAQGASGEGSPRLRALAFRIVDEDADGRVGERELEAWVARALEHRVLRDGADREPCGPFGLFGTRALSPRRLARKWLRRADADRDGHLSPEEFDEIAGELRARARSRG